jgi:hypothetical protein
MLILAEANIYKNLQIPRCKTLYKGAKLGPLIHFILPWTINMSVKPLKPSKANYY